MRARGTGPLYWILTAAAVLAATCLQAQTGEEGARQKPAASQSALTVRVTGEDRVTLVARKAPLATVLQRLSSSFPRTPVMVDAAALPLVSRAEPVTMELTGASLETALRRVCRSAGLELWTRPPFHVVSSPTSPSRPTLAESGEPTPPPDARPDTAGSYVSSTLRVTSRNGLLTVSANNARVDEVLQALVRTQPGVSLLVDEQTTASAPTITAELKGVSFEEAFQAILRQAGLRAQKQGNVYTLRPRSGRP